MNEAPFGVLFACDFSIYTTFRGKKCSIKWKIKHTTNGKQKLKPLEIAELFSNFKRFLDGGEGEI